MCEFCDYLKTDFTLDIHFVFQSLHFVVALSNKQNYLGRVIVIAKRHCEDLKDLNGEEWSELKEVITAVENSVTDTFHPTLFNWCCLMNDAYKSDNPIPHVHLHMRPRYRNKTSVFGIEFIDDEFGHHYGLNKKSIEIGEETIKKIVKKMQQQEDVQRFLKLSSHFL